MYNEKEKTYYVIVPIFCAVLTVIGTIIGSYIVQDLREDSFVKSMAGRFEQVNENMELEQALDIVFEEKEQLKQSLDDINTEKQQLQTKLEELISANVYNPALVIDGLKKEESVGKGVAIIDNNIYFSSDICSRIWGVKPIFNELENVVFFSENNEILVENKVDLINENVIYDGQYLKIYKPSDGETFSMGSDTFNKGFTVGSDNYSLFGEGNGYALFDLKGKYSKLNINVARVNRSDLEIEDAILKVYLNGEYVTEYSLNGQQPPTSITIDLNYADNLKLEVCGSKIVYGFADCTLEK